MEATFHMNGQKKKEESGPRWMIATPPMARLDQFERITGR